MPPETRHAPSGVAVGRRVALACAEAPRTSRTADITRALLTIDERRVGGRAVLSVVGEIDISTAAELGAAIETAGTRAFEVWVDLSNTTFMDSSGLHAMVEARARLVEASRRLTLICPAGPILRVLTVTGLDQLFEIHASRSAAHYETTA